MGQEKQKGLELRYEVVKRWDNDREEISPFSEELKYFVLDPTKAGAYGAASRKALRVYAETIRLENPVLATDLSLWLSRIYANLGGLPSETPEESQT